MYVQQDNNMYYGQRLSSILLILYGKDVSFQHIPPFTTVKMVKSRGGTKSEFRRNNMTLE